MRKFIAWGLVVACCAGGSAWGQEQRPANEIGFAAGAGLIISPDYNDFLDEAYADYDLAGGFGWGQIYVGAVYRLQDNLVVSPTVALMANIVSATGGSMDEDYINYIILPAVAARFAFEDAPSLYVGGELNYNIPNTTSDEIEFSSGGLGYGALIGFTFGGGFCIEAGYLNIPMEGKSDDVIADENLGGGYVVRGGIAF
jgi:hypothetical protein